MDWVGLGSESWSSDELSAVRIGKRFDVVVVTGYEVKGGFVFLLETFMKRKQLKFR